MWFVLSLGIAWGYWNIPGFQYWKAKFTTMEILLKCMLTHYCMFIFNSLKESMMYHFVCVIPYKKRDESSEGAYLMGGFYGKHYTNGSACDSIIKIICHCTKKGINCKRESSLVICPVFNDSGFCAVKTDTFSGKAHFRPEFLKALLMFHANQGEWEAELTGAFYPAYSCLPALDITSENRTNGVLSQGI